MSVDVLGATQHLIVEFARGGGGGSGSGGGGDGIAGLALVGYVPMHFVGAIVRHFKNNEVEWVGGQIVGWVVCGVFGGFLLFLMVYLGFYALIMAAGAPLGMGAGLYNWFGKLKQSKQTKAALQLAGQQDKAWDEAALLKRAGEIFTRYQKDWSNYDTTSMKEYMTPAYHYHASLMMTALQQAARKDNVNEPTIMDMIVTEVDDEADNSQDQVVVGITAKANDILTDTRDNSVLFQDNSSFTEFWRFQRSGDEWLLAGIQEATASSWTHNAGLEAFAASNQYCYSADWGWLLLPRRGQLFGDAKFGTSDINNHVIGVYNNCLVQLYTYVPNPNSSPAKSYLIAQTNVPKTYGNIVVRRKHGFNIFGIRGLNKVSMEWGDFNKKYDVYASDVEQATSFELLHPVFMEQLEALPFEVNIEVVDNVVYLYSQQKSQVVDSVNYETMLGILREAFKQMKL